MMGRWRVGRGGFLRGAPLAGALLLAACAGLPEGVSEPAPEAGPEPGAAVAQPAPQAAKTSPPSPKVKVGKNAQDEIAAPQAPAAARATDETVRDRQRKQAESIDAPSAAGPTTAEVEKAPPAEPGTAPESTPEARSAGGPSIRFKGGIEAESDDEPDKELDRGTASWYGLQFHGRTTANGERYNMYELTAAHKTLPFGTIVNVRSLQSGRTVEVRINDRGPYVDGRVIDLSRAAAEELGMTEQGIKPVSLTVKQWPTPAQSTYKSGLNSKSKAVRKPRRARTAE